MRSITTDGAPSQRPCASIQCTFGAGTPVCASAFSTANSRARSVLSSVPAASRMSIRRWAWGPASSVQAASKDQFSRDSPPALLTSPASTMSRAEGIESTIRPFSPSTTRSAGSPGVPASAGERASDIVGFPAAVVR